MSVRRIRCTSAVVRYGEQRLHEHSRTPCSAQRYGMPVPAQNPKRNCMRTSPARLAIQEQTGRCRSVKNCHANSRRSRSATGARKPCRVALGKKTSREDSMSGRHPSSYNIGQRAGLAIPCAMGHNQRVGYVCGLWSSSLFVCRRGWFREGRETLWASSKMEKAAQEPRSEM